ncbi:MAG TPA: ferritin-like domain-containing protein [Pseudobdellovibrionaceae bacterium]|nr:ferritin-like domain-containing protein [Pseudobdellovibrionaceae bacterium]
MQTEANTAQAQGAKREAGQQAGQNIGQNSEQFTQPLIKLLQSAHAGELAAAHAYEGHARSLSAPEHAEDYREIRRIQREEMEHRQCVAHMLQLLGAGPRPSRERIMGLIGHVIWRLCVWTRPLWGSWYVAMFGAGWLESTNVGEYVRAAHCAKAAGHETMVPELLRMAEVEREHEAFFRRRCQSHILSRYLPLWPPPENSTIDTTQEKTPL